MDVNFRWQRGEWLKDSLCYHRMESTMGKEKILCSCNRSPIKECLGWHSLTMQAYQVALKNYKESEAYRKYIHTKARVSDEKMVY